MEWGHVSWMHGVVTALMIVFVRLSMCLPMFRSPARRRPSAASTTSCMVVWGSGGHTTEMLRLIQKLDMARYCPMHFVLASSDTTSEGKITSSHCPCADGARWHRVPRSREVKQSYFTSVVTTAYATLHSCLLVLRVRPQTIVCNGPGTCVPIVMSAFLLRMAGLGQPVVVFAESFCRVTSLSVTGKLLYYFADRFVVQWPQLAAKYPRAEYHGTMI